MYCCGLPPNWVRDTAKLRLPIELREPVYKHGIQDHSARVLFRRRHHYAQPAGEANAISHSLVDELLAALDEVEHSRAQVVILTGAGKAFCAGMDLDELKDLLDRTQDEKRQHPPR